MFVDKATTGGSRLTECPQLMHLQPSQISVPPSGAAVAAAVERESAEGDGH